MERAFLELPPSFSCGSWKDFSDDLRCLAGAYPVGFGPASGALFRVDPSSPARSAERFLWKMPNHISSREIVGFVQSGFGNRVRRGGMPAIATARDFLPRVGNRPTLDVARLLPRASDAPRDRRADAHHVDEDLRPTHRTRPSRRRLEIEAPQP